MQTVGLIGGMSWESSAEYYRLMNELVREEMGGLHSARCLLYSLDFAEIERLQSSGAWKEAEDLLVAAGQSLELAGADFLLLCTNTMHKVADALEAAVSIPLVHIADVARRGGPRGRRRPGRALGHGVHDGAVVLQRPAGHARPRGHRPLSGRSNMSSTGPSTRSSAWVSSARSRARRSRRSSAGW